MPHPKSVDTMVIPIVTAILGDRMDDFNYVKILRCEGDRDGFSAYTLRSGRFDQSILAEEECSDLTLAISNTTHPIAHAYHSIYAKILEKEIKESRDRTSHNIRQAMERYFPEGKR